MKMGCRSASKCGLSILLAFEVCLLVPAWTKPSAIWLWKVALLTQELGHWVSLAALFGACAAFWNFKDWQGRTLGLAHVLAAAFLLIPAMGVASLTPGFQWARLWLPWIYSHPQVIVSRESYGKGPEMDIIVYRPAAMAPPRPWVLVVHGGGWDSGTAEEFEQWNTELASHGLVVLAMNYRLAPDQPWPAQREDVALAAGWARGHAIELGLDAAKLVVMGRSAGGQIAAASVYGQPDIKAMGVVAFYAPMDLIFARQYAYEGDILNSLKLLRQLLGGDPDQAGENYRTASAFVLVEPASPPALLVHGTNDSLVWVRQSQRMAQKLEELGVPHRYIELPWATHACDYFPSSPDGQLTMRAVLDFIHSLK